MPKPLKSCKMYEKIHSQDTVENRLHKSICVQIKHEESYFNNTKIHYLHHLISSSFNESNTIHSR